MMPIELISIGEVSAKIKTNLAERAKRFHIHLSDVAITHLKFSSEYIKSIEDKQIAQQEAERAKYTVKKAKQDKLSKILKAEGDAKSAELIGKAIENNPSYIELRQLNAASTIAQHVSQSKNKLYLNSDTLLLNVMSENQTQNRL